MSLINISDSIKSSLLLKLEKSRKNLIISNDIYLDDEHKKLCHYYDKYLKSKLEHYSSDDLQLFEDYYNKFTELKKELILIENKHQIHYYDDIENNKIYNYKTKYNNYNKKFYNKIYNELNIDNIQKFLYKNDIFIKSLNKKEIYTLKYYTYHGDLYLNAFINNDFTPKLIAMYSGSIVDDDTDICLFLYQFIEIFKDIYTNDEEFIIYLKENYLKFDSSVYNKLFNLYIHDMKNILKKAPLTDDILYLYRGTELNYVSEKSKKGYYKSNQFISTSLFAEIAYNYTKKKNRYMYRITVNKGLPLIFVEGISLAKNDFEVIIPINSLLYIDYAMKYIKYNKFNNYICPSEYTDTDLVKVIDIIYIK